MRWRLAWLIALGLACLLLVWVADHVSRGASQAPSPVPMAIETRPEGTPEETTPPQTPRETRPRYAIRSGAVSGVILVEENLKPPAGPVLVVLKLRVPPRVDIKATEYRTTTDENGRFGLADVLYPALYQLSCTAEELGIRHEASVYIREDREEIEVLVEPKTLVTGFVLDTTGAPIPGARVYTQLVRYGIHPRSGRQTSKDLGERTKCDEEGAFRLELPLLRSREEKVRISAVALAHFPGEGSLDVSTLARCEAVIRLQPCATLSGRVVDENGKPLEKVCVELAVFRPSRPKERKWDMWHWGAPGIGGGGHGDDEIKSRSVWTKADGRFRVSPIIDGHSAYIICGRSDRPHWFRALRRLTSDLAMGDIVMRKPERSLSVRLRYADGQPGTDVRVSFQSQALSQWAQLNSPKLKTNVAGVAQSTFLEDGQIYSVWIHAWKGLKVIERVVVTDGMTITIPD